jgi:Glycosyl-4,4'-diaponeurosporenoate acyltransferase
MRKLRDVVALLVVAATFAFSLAMIRQLVGFASPWFGLMVMLVFLGLVAFARPLFVLRLPSFLRKVRAWERNGALYKALRVPAFGELLRRTPLRFLNPMVYLSRDHDGPSVVLAQLESAEAAHLVAAALIVPYIIHACVQGWVGAVAGFMVIQIGFNLYPILHLRWARIRLTRVHERALSHRKQGVR